MTKLRGPIITLVAGVVLAAVLMVLNLNVTNKDRAPAADAGNAATTATTPPAATSAPAVAVTTAPPAVLVTTAPPDATPVTYAGNVDGKSATIAIVIKEGKAVAYLCDGRSAEAWLQGTATDGTLDLTGASEARLTGTYGNGVAAGTVSATGKQWSFTVPTVAPPSGLYRATATVRNARLVGGWIVLGDGRQVGLVTLGGTTLAAPPLDTAARTATVEGTAVTVAPLDGTGL